MKIQKMLTSAFGNAGKILALGVLFTILAGISPIMAEADNGKFLPDDPFGVENFYVSIEPAKLQLPLTFLGLGDLNSVTPLGYGLAAELGYNWSGWLMGAYGAWSTFGEGAGPFKRMQNFQNLSIGVHLSRVLSSRTINSLPDWLELVPNVGFGVNFIESDYYPSERAEKEGNLRHLKFGDDDGIALYYNLGFHVAFDIFTDQFIPYVGAEYTVFVDESGTAGFPALLIGVRSYPASFFKEKPVKKKPVKKEAKQQLVVPEVVELETAEEDFTPDGDGINDEIVFNLDTGDIAPEDVNSWRFAIFDPAGNTFKTFEGTGKMPGVLKWDGSGDNADDVILSLTTYTAVLNALLENGEVFRSESEIETGLLVERQPDGTLRIRVNSIFFDPNNASFEKITQAQREVNEDTFDILSKHLNKFTTYEIIVEGHANNVSGTEEEDINELIPLSTERAEKIVTELSNRGVARNRMTAVGKGGSQPLASRENRTQWWKNRRVEFVLVEQD